MEHTELLEEKARLEHEIAGLKTVQRLLANAIGELAHDGRRLSDALERQSGQAANVEIRRRALTENRLMSEAELADIDTRLARAKRRLAAVDCELHGRSGR